MSGTTLVIVVIMAMGVGFNLLTGGFLTLSAQQMLVGGGLSFVLHLLGTGLPVMVFTYAILFPRYLRLSGSLVTTAVLGGVSFGLLTLFPPGLMKSYLTLRTANAWVHLWGYHAISAHVTADTPMIVEI